MRACQHRQPLPTEPGRYFWTEWSVYVNVRRSGKALLFDYNGRTYKVSPQLAGDLEEEAAAMGEHK